MGFLDKAGHVQAKGTKKKTKQGQDGIRFGLRSLGSKETNVRLDIQGHVGRTNVASVIYFFLRNNKSIIVPKIFAKKKRSLPFSIGYVLKWNRFVSDDWAAVFKQFVENWAGIKRPYFPVIVLNGRFLCCVKNEGHRIFVNQFKYILPKKNTTSAQNRANLHSRKFFSFLWMNYYVYIFFNL